MKNSITLLLLSVSAVLWAQSATEVTFRKIIEDSFQEIFSNLDETKVAKYYTEDFLLMEDGELWNLDSLKSVVRSIKRQFTGPENKENKFERFNRFEYLKSHIDENSGWIAYHNYADIHMNGVSIAKLHWIETANFIREKNEWKIQILHSTKFKENEK